MRIDIDAGGYVSACTDFYDANHDVCAALEKLIGVIDGCGGMAGTDTGGEGWAAEYDPVATNLVKGLSDMTTSLASMANLLNSSLVNHKGAENGALVYGPPIGDIDTGDSDPNHYTETISAADPPSAKGGTGDQPGWWHWIASHVEGLLWPDADTGKLRSAGNAWKDCGTSVTLSAYYAESAASMVGSETSPEVADAVAACNEIKSHLNDLGSACSTIGQACLDYAKHVDDAHKEVEDELVSFVEWTIAIEAAGGLLSVVTVGLSEAAAQAAEGAEVANAAAKVVRILKALEGLAETVSTAIRALTSKVTEVLGKLAKFLNPRVEKALVETGEKLGIDSLSTEEKSAYEKYVARKKAQGKTPKGPEEWKRLKDQVALNKANGDAFENEMMASDGVTPGQGGWSNQVNYETSDGSLRRWDYANDSTQQAVEVKSGTTPTKEGLVQLNKDEEAIRNGWDVTWHLKKELSQTMMNRIKELAAKYPGKFHYDIGG